MRKSIFGLLLILSMVAMACGGGLEGEEVLMFGAPATDGPDGKAIQASFDAFEEETGIIVTYVGSENFESEFCKCHDLSRFAFLMSMFHFVSGGKHIFFLRKLFLTQNKYFVNAIPS